MTIEAEVQEVRAIATEIEDILSTLENLSDRLKATGENVLQGGALEVAYVEQGIDNLESAFDWIDEQVYEAEKSVELTKEGQL